jgi:hypothetical protein
VKQIRADQVMHDLGAVDLADFVPTMDRMPAIVARFNSDCDALQRSLILPYSPTSRSRMKSFLHAWHATTTELDFAELTRSDRVDWLLMRGMLDSETRRLDRVGDLLSEAEMLLPFLNSLVALEEDRRSVIEIDPSTVAKRLDNARTHVAHVTRDIRNGMLPDSWRVAGYATKVIASVRSFLEDWFEHYHRYDPLFTWWVEKPYRQLDKSLAEYADFLRAELAYAGDSGIAGAPIGRDGLVAELDYAQVQYTPEELIDAAREEMEWCRLEMDYAARELGFRDWRGALDHVKSAHAAPGEQPHLVKALAREAIEYVESNNLISVPPLARECWHMAMMTPEGQKINPFFLGGETIVVSFPTSDMDHAQKEMSLRGNNRSFARATVHHELIPGHHLQGFYQKRYRPYRRAFNTPFWIEGWTLHWEMLLWERGFARTPEDKIGMLFWRTHRCARVIFSLMFHLGQMTPQECIDMLVDEVGHERDNAIAEVRRSFEADYAPLYQCAYLIGGKQMHALYHDLVDSGRMTARTFHDAVLRENSMPIPMLRAILTNQPLTPDFKPEWRFWRSAKSSRGQRDPMMRSEAVAAPRSAQDGLISKG